MNAGNNVELKSKTYFEFQDSINKKTAAASVYMI